MDWQLELTTADLDEFFYNAGKGQDTGHGSVDVRLTRPDLGGFVVITGKLPAILAWLINTTDVEDQAVEIWSEAAANGHLFQA